MQIVKRDSLPEGGFAGLREHRLIKDRRLFGPEANHDGSWPGLGNVVYLADARYMPHGETRMHSHHELDIVSVLVEGRIAHQGSLRHGADLSRDEVQVQRAGGEGFSHNEVNPDASWNRMIQIWALPEVAGQAADYRLYKPAPDKLTRVYGGEDSRDTDFPAKTRVDIALLADGQQIDVDEAFVAYLTRGTGLANTKPVEEGDLFRGVSLEFEARGDVQLIIIQAGNR